MSYPVDPGERAAYRRFLSREPMIYRLASDTCNRGWAALRSTQGIEDNNGLNRIFWLLRNGLGFCNTYFYRVYGSAYTLSRDLDLRTVKPMSPIPSTTDLANAVLRDLEQVPNEKSYADPADGWMYKWTEQEHMKHLMRCLWTYCAKLKHDKNDAAPDWLPPFTGWNSPPLEFLERLAHFVLWMAEELTPEHYESSPLPDWLGVRLKSSDK